MTKRRKDFVLPEANATFYLWEKGRDCGVSISTQCDMLGWNSDTHEHILLLPMAHFLRAHRSLSELESLLFIQVGLLLADLSM